MVATRKGIQINGEFSQPTIIARLNREKLTRVLENLLSNAIKFTKKKGVINLKVSEQQDKLQIQVQDTGIGIPQSMHETIFNKFTKAKRKGTEGEQTTGLGLFIAKRIVQLHGGKIWFESIPSVGTTFFIC